MEALVNVQGMGAIVHEEGVFFRVWAPNANAVFVTGSFCDWNENAHELQHEGEGYWGLNIEEAKNGDQYKFVIHNGDMVLFRNDPYARQVIHSNGNSVVYEDKFDWEDDVPAIAPWNELVIYELHVGSFHVTEPGKPGNFYTAIEKIPYLKNAGVNAVEIMPPYEFAGGFSWGYNPSLPFAIETEYGGPDALKAFVKACHENDIAVILDVVYNHFGPGDLDLWKFDGWSENDKGGIYFYNDHRAETPWGETRPDYGRKEVRQYLRDNALMWLDEYHIDGLRFDAVSYITNINGERDPATDLPEGHEIIKWINGEIRERFSGRIVIAEDMKRCNYVTGLSENDGLAFSAQWDPGFVYNVREVLREPMDEYRDMYKIEQAILFKFRDDYYSRVIYTESHDEIANGKQRVTEDISPGDPDNWFAIKRSILGLSLVLTAPGIPMMFQGQMMNQGGFFSDDQPLDWDNSVKNRGLIKLAADLIRLRKNTDGNTKGLTGQSVETLQLDNDQKFIAFRRWADAGPGDDVVVVMNYSHEMRENYSIRFPADGEWKLRFNSDDKKYHQHFGNGDVTDVNVEDGQAVINLPPYATLIFSQG